jgi:hypothetical protein
MPVHSWDLYRINFAHLSQRDRAHHSDLMPPSEVCQGDRRGRPPGERNTIRICGGHDSVQERLDERPDAMILRRSTVEHPFGTIKAWIGATHFKMRTLAHVATEMALHVLAYNLKRVIAIFGVPKLIEAIAGFIAWLVIEMGLKKSAWGSNRLLWTA